MEQQQNASLPSLLFIRARVQESPGDHSHRAIFLFDFFFVFLPPPQKNCHVIVHESAFEPKRLQIHFM